MNKKSLEHLVSCLGFLAYLSQIVPLIIYGVWTFIHSKPRETSEVRIKKLSSVYNKRREMGI